MANVTQRKKSFGVRFVMPFQSKQSGIREIPIDESPPASINVEEQRSRSSRLSARNKLRKRSAPDGHVLTNKAAAGDASKGVRAERMRGRSVPNTTLQEPWERDKQTGEIVDHTEMLHSLGLQDDGEDWSAQSYSRTREDPDQSGEVVLSKLTPELWKEILEYLTPSDLASLAMTCKAFFELLGPDTWVTLRHPHHHRHRVRFLSHMDHHMPHHLLCFACGTYHRRIQVGEEILKPTNIHNPIFNCPHVSNPSKRVSRIRLTSGRTLPFTFVQLVLRAHRFSPSHGIPLLELGRRYKDSSPYPWSHNTRYAIINGHLLIRVISTCFPPPPPLPPSGKRTLLYSPNDDYNPYFSVCPHWRDGNLMPAVKCALSHIPAVQRPSWTTGPQNAAANIRARLAAPVSPMVTLCHEVCRPMRRCPSCPTEYLIEVKLAEDRDDSDPRRRFRYALSVTRWSDLGDGSTPFPEHNPEWAALSQEPLTTSTTSAEDGENEENFQRDSEVPPEEDEMPCTYDSFAKLGRRAISGIFESANTSTGDTLPGQRMVSMNPTGIKKGEAGHDWY